MEKLSRLYGHISCSKNGSICPTYQRFRSSNPIDLNFETCRSC
nr:MAG TPA: hypothetical protein [Caudoviricetes sp.]